MAEEILHLQLLESQRCRTIQYISCAIINQDIKYQEMINYALVIYSRMNANGSSNIILLHPSGSSYTNPKVPAPTWGFSALFNSIYCLMLQSPVLR